MRARRRRRRRWGSRLRGWIRQLLAFLFTNVGVIVLVLAYTIAGAFMFQKIEGARELERAQNMTRERNATAYYLWENVTLALNPFNVTELESRIKCEVEQYQKKLVTAVRRGWDGGRGSRQWSFSSAFLYCLTVISTIGYGHLSPRTALGKMATVLYALLGMPLFLLYLSNVGSLLARWFKCVYALACLCRGCPGFTRRRVVVLAAQTDVSDPESIEGLEYSDLERPSYRDHHLERPSTRDYHLERPSYRDYQLERPSYRDYQLERPSYRDHQLERPSTRDHQLERPPYRDHRLEYNHEQYSEQQNHRRAAYIRSASFPDCRQWQGQWQHDKGARRGASAPGAAGGYDSASSSAFTYVTFDAQTITVPISVCVAIMVGYILFGSMLFSLWEQWGHVDGAYFCFISLSSIGFGDFVPGERVYSARIETSFIACSMYLMLGMALVAMCFNLMQEQVIHYCAAVKRALKRMCRCKR